MRSSEGRSCARCGCAIPTLIAENGEYVACLSLDCGTACVHSILFAAAILAPRVASSCLYTLSTVYASSIMAPKKAAGVKEPAPKKAAGVNKPAAKPAEKRAARVVKEDTKLKRFNIDFLAEISMLCQLPTGDVRKVMEALRKVLLKEVREKKSTRVPNIVLLRIKTLKARPATTKALFGVEREVPAKLESTKVVCTVLQNLKADAGA